MSIPSGSLVVAAVFADQRDAHYAMRLLASSTDIAARYTLRAKFGERGEVQLVILEAVLANPAHASRVETCILGAHGVVIPAEDAQPMALVG